MFLLKPGVVKQHNIKHMMLECIVLLIQIPEETPVRQPEVEAIVENTPVEDCSMYRSEAVVENTPVENYSIHRSEAVVEYTPVEDDSIYRSDEDEEIEEDMEEQDTEDRVSEQSVCRFLKE